MTHVVAVVRVNVGQTEGWAGVCHQDQHPARLLLHWPYSELLHVRLVSLFYAGDYNV